MKKPLTTTVPAVPHRFALTKDFTYSKVGFGVEKWLFDPPIVGKGGETLVVGVDAEGQLYATLDGEPVKIVKEEKQ